MADLDRAFYPQWARQLQRFLSDLLQYRLDPYWLPKLHPDLYRPRGGRKAWYDLWYLVPPA